MPPSRALAQATNSATVRAGTFSALMASTLACEVVITIGRRSRAGS